MPSGGGHRAHWVVRCPRGCAHAVSQKQNWQPMRRTHMFPGTSSHATSRIQRSRCWAAGGVTGSFVPVPSEDVSRTFSVRPLCGGAKSLRRLVELRGIEPLTSAVRWRRVTESARPPPVAWRPLPQAVGSGRCRKQLATATPQFTASWNPTTVRFRTGGSSGAPARVAGETAGVNRGASGLLRFRPWAPSEPP